MSTIFLGFAVTGPIQIIASLFFLYDIFGYSTFAGFGVLVFFFIFNILASKYQKVIKQQEMVNVLVFFFIFNILS